MQIQQPKNPNPASLLLPTPHLPCPPACPLYPAPRASCPHPGASCPHLFACPPRTLSPQPLLISQLPCPPGIITAPLASSAPPPPPPPPSPASCSCLPLAFCLHLYQNNHYGRSRTPASCAGAGCAGRVQAQAAVQQGSDVEHIGCAPPRAAPYSISASPSAPLAAARRVCMLLDGVREHPPLLLNQVGVLQRGRGRRQAGGCGQKGGQGGRPGGRRVRSGGCAQTAPPSANTRPMAFNGGGHAPCSPRL